MAILFIWVRWTDRPSGVKPFFLAAIVIFAVRFVMEGHVPWSGFTGYGPAHYTVHKILFIVEVLLTCGLAWLAARLGWAIL